VTGNVEIVRRVYERLNRGDVEGVVEFCDDDFLIGHVLEYARGRRAHTRV
jgi:ketosteroid isomerase-like protein